MPGREVLPGPLRRSPKKAQETWVKTPNSAAETYGDGERAHRTAFAAVKHSFEKVGDRWQPKKKRGPSDPGAKSGGPDQRKPTYGGVDVEGHTKAELYERAKKLGVRGRSDMTKNELASAIARK